mmetsp:Transcript_19392/g.27296  ORF Transcript_19392/g.27296 Transcript_19392/m.27296 type:complete len:252 (-) Transcript_19392:35-790(-)
MGKHHLGCGASCAKGLMVFFNFIFLLGGGALIGLGAYAVASNSSHPLPDLANVSLSQVHAYGIGLIVLGCVVFVMSFLGCCGAARESKCLLGTFATIVALLLIAQTSIAIYAFVHKGPVTQAIHDGKIWNEMSKTPKLQEQIEEDFACCGWSSPADRPVGAQCQAVPPQFTQGCLAAVTDFVEHGFEVIAITAICVAVVELFAFIFAVGLMCSMKSPHQRHIDDQTRLLNEARYANRQDSNHGYKRTHTYQ